ncbi:MAG: tyrosine transporter, partial [Pseudomonadota bacterium]|nr:tyrosine transporter [Pseudomonadota bacterium]
ILLIAGTSIGAGMLALPITTGSGGFYYALILMLVCFGYMLLSVFLLLEANLYETNMDANIISMSKRRLGVGGAAVGWISFLMLLYSVAAAYLSAGGSLVGQVLIGDKVLTHAEAHLTIIGFAIVFGVIVFFGAWLVDLINRFLMIGLIASYLVLALFVTPHVELSNLQFGQPKYLLAAFPIVLLSFTSHIIVPSLRIYMKNDVKQLKKALLYGSLVPLIFYVLWEFLILGVLPMSGEYSLTAIAARAHPVSGLTHALNEHLGLLWVASVVGAFSFFALVTSFLGVILSLIDFLADGLQITKNAWGRFRLLLLTLIPPLIFALYFESGFMLAISYAGVFVAILYGILPPLMIWKARYSEHLTSEFRVPGGKPVLLFSIFGAVAVIILQVLAELHYLPTP